MIEINDHYFGGLEWRSWNLAIESQDRMRNRIDNAFSNVSILILHSDPNGSDQKQDATGKLAAKVKNTLDWMDCQMDAVRTREGVTSTHAPP